MTMPGDVFIKTDKGREEIATRNCRLAARLRGLLLLIDGQRTLETLSGNFGPAGKTTEYAAVLLRDGFIEVAEQRISEPAMPPAPAALAAAALSAPHQAPPVSMHDIYSARRR